MLNAPLLWLLAGSLLCLLEAIFPTAFVELIMGISAIVVAVIALIVPNLTVQVVLWLLISTIAVLASRRLLTPKRRSFLVGDTEGKTLTEIEPGEAGRVLYEGSSWRAICADENLAIASDEKVYILHRKGNTLIVMPILGSRV